MMPPNDELLACLCKEAYEYDSLNVDGDVQATIAQVSGVNIVAFRGTEFDFEDILRDLRAMPWWSSKHKCFVHAGFLKAARLALPVVEKLKGPLILTGHSLGGAIARNVAILLDRPEVSVVTFGEPRSIIGTLAPRKPGDAFYIPERSKRYVNGNDIVPRHPWPIWGYRHQEKETRIGLLGNRFTKHRINEYSKEMKASGG